MRSTNNTNFSQESFKRGLQEWVNQVPYDSNENRTEAARRILTCQETNSDYLSLNALNLTSLPPEIGNLAAVKNITLSFNQLTSLPPEIGNLAAVKNITLSFNQLTSLPPEIGNLAALESIELRNNKLINIPESLFRDRDREKRIFLNLEQNCITYAEAQRLSYLALDSRVTLQASIYEDPVFDSESVTDGLSISEQIIARTPEEQKEAVRDLFKDQSLSNFHQFIFECSKTAGWQQNREAMLNALTSLTCDISNPKKESLRAKCLAIAETASGTCGDRVGLSYTQMFFAQENENIAVADMNLQQLVNCARIGSVIKFLSEKAQEKIEQLKVHAGFLDPIETHLAYLQAAPRLGANLPVSGILYARCSNVSDQDLNTAVVQFNSENINLRIADYIYEDPELKTHPKINQLITEIGKRPEFNNEKLEDENEYLYLERLKEVGVALKGAVVGLIAEILTNGNSADVSYSESITSLEGITNVIENETRQNEVVSVPENSLPSTTLSNQAGLLQRISRLFSSCLCVRDDAVIYPR